MSKDKLGKRQQAIYDYICAYSAEHGYPPSVRRSAKLLALPPPPPCICT